MSPTTSPTAPPSGQDHQVRPGRAPWTWVSPDRSARGYLAAGAGAVAAVLLTAAAAPRVPLGGALLYVAVAAAAAFGGIGPALAAAALAAAGSVAAELYAEAGLLGGSALWARSAALLLVAAAGGWAANLRRDAEERSREAASAALRAAEALQLEKRRTETILQSVSDGITVQDARGRMVFANDAAAHLLGYTGSGALASEPAAEIYQRLDPRDEADVPVAPEDLPGPRALAGEPAPERLVSFRSPDTGEERWALLRARAVRDESGRAALAVSVLHDLTERVRYERALEANARDLHQLTARLEVTIDQLRVERESAFTARAEAEHALERVVTLQRVTAALSEARTPDEVAQVVLDRGMEAMEARSGLLLLFNSAGDAIEVVRAAGVPPQRVEQWMRTGAVDLARLKSALRRVELGSLLPSRIDDVSALPIDSLRRVLESDTLVIVPLATRERPLGLLVFDVAERRTLESRDRDLLMALGRQCAQALDRARLFAAARDARDEAEHASRAKSQFLAVMSHELRTPLNAILGYEELLETEVSGPVSSIQRHHLSRIRESTKHLLTLIEQILSLSRIQGGREDVRIEEIDAAALAREVASSLEPQLTKKGLALHLDVPEVGGLLTDGRKVRQILLNVLSNAVKFTDQGSVSVTLIRGDGALCFTVLDTGPGIDEREREHVFEPFVQLHGEGMLPGGTGLGLAVARELARHLGGDITLESRVGEGSAFTILIPQASALPAQQAGQLAAAATPPRPPT